MKSIKDVTDAEKALMCLSRETQEGLKLTGAVVLCLKISYDLWYFHAVLSFVEVTKYLLNLPGVEKHYVLSECFSQDPLENYFGQVRARGGRCENPTVRGCLESAQSLRVQGSLALQPVRGNSSRKRRLFPGPEHIDSEPLQKKPRKPHPRVHQQ